MNKNEIYQIISQGIYTLGENEWDCERLGRELEQIELEFLIPNNFSYFTYGGNFREVLELSSREGLFYSKEDLVKIVKIFSRLLRLQNRLEEAEELESTILLFKKNLEESRLQGFYRQDSLYHIARREERLGDLQSVLKNQMDVFLLYVLEEEPKLTKTGRISLEDVGNLALTCDLIAYNEKQGLEGGERNYPTLELMRNFALVKNIIYPMGEHLTIGSRFEMYKLLSEVEFIILWLDFILSREAMNSVYNDRYSYLEQTGEDFIHHFFMMLLWASQDNNYIHSPMKKNKTIFYLSLFLSLSLLEEKKEKFVLTQMGREILKEKFI